MADKGREQTGWGRTQVTNGQKQRATKSRWMDRLQAKRVAFARPATGIVSQPEPRSIGQPARGRQLLAGNFRFAGELIEAEGQSPWELTPPNLDFAEALHGFAWLDDLIAVGEPRARKAATGWVQDWIARFGPGHGPGWTPDLTGRRLIRWLGHALTLLRGQERAEADAFYRSAAQQTLFLARRWRSASSGLPRIEALTGLIYAALSLTGMEAHLAPALAALEQQCDREIDAEGGLPSRNPEELLEVFTLLGWAAAALRENGHTPGPALTAALERIAPTLRALRHADGGLARFHGGGAGPEGRLERALADAASPTRPGPQRHMGFARLSAGRCSVIIDAAPPSYGPTSQEAHASTLAFELTSGRRPLVVNCGPGAHFGADWQRAARATPSHSTLEFDGLSSAHIAAEGDLLTPGPRDVLWDILAEPGKQRIEAGHDGWRADYGLTHARMLELQSDGRALLGEDILTTLTPEDEARFDQALDGRRLEGFPFAIRFHLHPEVNASLDMNGAAVSLGLPSGEIWVFRGDAGAALEVVPSYHLENGRLQPRASSQMVLSGRVLSYATRVRWALTKAQDMPIATRDTHPGPGETDERDEP